MGRQVEFHQSSQVFSTCEFQGLATVAAFCKGGGLDSARVASATAALAFADAAAPEAVHAAEAG